AEGGAGAQADAGGAGGGLGDQARVQLDLDHAAAEELVQVALQLQGQGGGRDRHLLGGREQLVVQLAGQLDEVVGGLAGGGAFARQRLVGAAKQAHGFGAGPGGAQRLEQARGRSPACRRRAEERPARRR